jgi:hypothetical protein
MSSTSAAAAATATATATPRAAATAGLSIGDLRNIYFHKRALLTTPEGHLVIGSSALCGALGIQGNDVRTVCKHDSDEALSELGFRYSRMTLQGKPGKGEIYVYITISADYASLVPDAAASDAGGGSDPFKFAEALVVIAPLARRLTEFQKAIDMQRAQRAAVMTLTGLNKRPRVSLSVKREREEDSADEDDEEYVPRSRGTKEARLKAQFVEAQQAEYARLTSAATDKDKEEELLLQRVLDLREEVAAQKRRAEVAEQQLAQSREDAAEGYADMKNRVSILGQDLREEKDELYYARKDADKLKRSLEEAEGELDDVKRDLRNEQRRRAQDQLQLNVLRKQVTALQEARAAAVQDCQSMRVYCQDLQAKVEAMMRS